MSFENLKQNKTLINPIAVALFLVSCSATFDFEKITDQKKLDALVTETLIESVVKDFELCVSKKPEKYTITKIIIQREESTNCVYSGRKEAAKTKSKNIDISYDAPDSELEIDPSQQLYNLELLMSEKDKIVISMIGNEKLDFEYIKSQN
jgi:hypothetical protein